MNKYFRLTVLFLFAWSLCVCGCDNGGDGYSTVRTVKLSFDTDGDGVPDVFDDYPDYADGYVFKTCNESDYITAHDSIETAIAKDTPVVFMPPSTFTGTIDDENTTDYFAVYLYGGETYSLVFYDPQKLDGRAVTFVPDVNVYKGPDESLPLELSVAGDASVIVLSFKPSQSHVYYIAVGSAEVVDEETVYDYRFDLIEDPYKKGMNLFFASSDGSGYTYTHEDILLLRGTLKPYIEDWTENGYPQTFKSGAEEAWEETVDYLARVNYETPCGDKTSLDPYVSGIPWNPDYDLGYGIDASTGYPADRIQAVASFTPPMPTNESTSTDTRIYFIKSDREYEREIQVGSDTSFIYLGVTFKASMSYAENIRYSETETTLIVKYFLRETEYRKFNPGDEKYVLTSAAKAYLENHKEEFRDQYGDYFIAGARYGAQYVASIHIKATSSEALRTVEAAISVAAQNFDNKETFKAKFREATKNCSIDFRRTTQGGDPNVLSAATTVDQVIDDVNKFVGSVTKNNRAPLEAYMYRYNQIEDGYEIPTEINVASCVFAKIRDLSEDYLALSCRAKVIAGLDETKFQAGIQDQYAQEYKDLTNDIRDNRKAICRDLSKITSYAARVKAAKDRFSDLINRFSFYEKLVAERKRWPGGGNSNIRRGFDGYNLSTTVNNDIQKTCWSDSYSQGWHVGWRYWYPSWEPGKDERVCFITIESQSTGDKWSDSNYPSLGNKKLALRFQSGYDRGGSWKVWAKAVYLGEDVVNYPFMW